MCIQSLLFIGLLLALVVGASLVIASANASAYGNDSCWAPFNFGHNSVFSCRAVLHSSAAPLMLRDTLAATGSPNHGLCDQRSGRRLVIAMTASRARVCALAFCSCYS
jgi:hypothetical protein